MMLSNVMVEADIHLRLLHTSILDIYKVFETIVCCIKGMPLHRPSCPQIWKVVFT